MCGAYATCHKFNYVMAQVTPDNVAKPIAGNKVVKKSTHLHLQEKLLKHIPENVSSVNLSVLYLHNNKIEEIQCLERAYNLKSLYLQNNRIRKIENLSNLRSLRKLFLGNNEISVIENLENCHLEQLHVEKQRLHRGEMLCFDPRSIMALSKSLQILNVSQNGLKSFLALAPLKYLKIFLAAHNRVVDINDILNTVQYWFYLFEASFVGNPVCKNHHYRENIIGSTVRLETLDNKQISETTRCFIKRLEKEMAANKPKTSLNLADINPHLPRNYAHPLQKAVSSSIIKSSYPKFQFASEERSYVPWKALPPGKSILKNKQK